MNKKSLWLITALMIFALIGVFALQLYYTRQAFRLNSEIFNQNVNKALNNVAYQVQKRNAIVHIEKKTTEVEDQQESNIRGQTEKIVAFKEKFKQNDDIRKGMQKNVLFNYLVSQDNNIRQNFITPLIISEREYKSFENQKDRDIIQGLKLLVNEDLNPETGEVIARRIYTRVSRPLIQFLILNNQLPDTIRYVAISPDDLLPRFISLASFDKDLEAKFKIEDLNARKKYQLELERLYSDTVVVSNVNQNFLEDVQKEMIMSNVPLAKRISKDVLDRLLSTELHNQGIIADYSFWLSTVRKDSLVFIKASNTKEDVLPENTYNITLFNKDVIRDPGILSVNFPNQRQVIFGKMGLTLGASFGFLLLLVFIFAYTIYSIIRQKKISEMKSDFINNMTHEFKTPVATIMLASEALKDPAIAEDKSRLSRLAGIIYDENVRLGNHIERVLSIARVENRELQLEENEVDMNELITDVVDSMELQLKHNNAEVILNLNAAYAILEGDELHLSNVIFNLIDNANKYSKNNPKITINTRNTPKKLVIEIVDEGIGMTKEQTKRIFDQFYRVPTGNLHDVKGFGLGLNYVKDIIDKMKAKIKVNSEKERGTTFEICFPVIMRRN